MKIYRCGSFIKIFDEYDACNIFSSDVDGRSLIFHGGEFHYVSTSPEVTNSRRLVKIGGYEYVLVGEGVFWLKNFLKGDYYLKSESKKKPELEPEIVFAHAYKKFYGLKDSALVIKEFDYPEEGKKSILFFDLKEERFAFRESSVSLPVIIDDFIYGWEYREKQLVKLDFDLNEMWRSKPLDCNFLYDSGSVRSQKPSKLGESIVINIGHDNNEKISVGSKNVRRYKNGLLYCFHQKDGELHWSREFEWSIEDLWVKGDRLFITTSTKLLELDPDSGETIREIETGLAIPEEFDRQSMGCLAELYASGAHLYYLHWVTGTILVYDLATLELLHRLELPGGWRPKGVQFEDENTGNLYVEVALGIGAPDFHRSAILELKPDRLNDPIEIEQGPPASIYMAPSETDPGKEELWVEITTPSLDDALRFGALHTQNHTYIQGHTLVGQHCDPNPKFNGKVHFRYFGSSESEERISEMLHLLEDGFNSWRKFGMYAGDGSMKLCEIDVQYVSTN